MCKSNWRTSADWPAFLGGYRGYAICTVLLSTEYCSLAVLAVKSGPLERLHCHTCRPGLCIDTADLFPFQVGHQVIESTIPRTVSVSNASLAPQ